MTPIIDSHCHLTRATYGDELESILDAAEAFGVGAFVTIGAGSASGAPTEAVALAHADPRVWATVGVHPHDAAKVSDEGLAEVDALADDPRVVAIGEMGLDYYYDFAPREDQARVFRANIEIARRVKKPIVIHNRESDEDCMRIFAEERVEDVGGVVHCFTSSWELAKDALDRGFYIGFTGIVSFKNAEGVRDVLRRVPRDRIVIETDSPYLAPVPKRGKRNEPAFVSYVADAVAATLEMDVEEVRQLTAENTRRLYRLPAA